MQRSQQQLREDALAIWRARSEVSSITALSSPITSLNDSITPRPSSARLVGTEHTAQLQSFLGKTLTLLCQALQVLAHLPQGLRLGGLALLQPFLVGVQLLFQRFK